MYPGAASRVVWWVMENRRRYFEMARLLLPRVAATVFIAHSQAAMWRSWSIAQPPLSAPARGLYKNGTGMGMTGEPGLGPEARLLLQRPLPECTPVVPLSLSPSLAILAGASPLAPADSSEQRRGRRMAPLGERERVAVAAADEARGLMRQLVRRAMGVVEEDTVVLCLSSVNPGKGQLGLVRATLTAWELLSPEARGGAGATAPGVPGEQAGVGLTELKSEPASALAPCSRTTSRGCRMRRRGGRLVLALGSIGCKSNKEQYLQLLRSTIASAAARSPAVAQNLRNGALLWVDSTLSVGPLYNAADVYVMNSQVGVGKRKGRARFLR